MAKAFPTAYGFGSLATGGRNVGGGSDVYFVTTTADTGTQGSLRHALTTGSVPRTVVFRVGGSFDLNSNLVVLRGNLYVAGQSAPGGGVMIRCRGCSLIFKRSNVILRFVTVRGGLDGISTNINTGGRDTNFILGYGSDAGTFITGSIADHCTFSWFTDQQMDWYGNVGDVTFQWCSIEEPVKCGHSVTLDSNNNRVKGPDIPHPFGSSIGTEPFFGTVIRVTMHHCCYSFSYDRTAYFGTYTGMQAGGLISQIEYINNLVYGWTGNGGSTNFSNAWYDSSSYNSFKSSINWPTGVATQANIIGNTFREHIYQQQGNNAGRGGLFVSDFARAYLKDNVYQPYGLAQMGPADGTGIPVNQSLSFGPDANDWVYPNVYAHQADYVRPTPWNLATLHGNAVPTDSATAAYDLILDNVGNCKVVRDGVVTNIRDSVSVRILGNNGVGGEVRNKTGTMGGVLDYNTWASGGNLSYPTIANGTPYTDSNNDGIQDGWPGMPGGATSLQIAANGYSYLENFLNEMAGDTNPSPPPDTTPPAAPTGVTIV